MPAPNVLRAKQREQIKPLIDELNRIFARQRRTDIALMSGLTNYQVGRILGDFLPAPTYLDITKLISAADMSPNEAAAIVGLYEPEDVSLKKSSKSELSAYERRILALLRHNRLTPTQRLLLAQVIEATVLGLEGHTLLDADGFTVDAEEPEAIEGMRKLNNRLPGSR